MRSVSLRTRNSGRPVRGPALVALVSSLALVLAGLVSAGPTSAQAAAATAAVGHGPVGWDTYRSMDALSRLRSGERTRQFSSFDRTGGNNDGFAGTYSCLRTSTAGCVIAEQTGAGELSSMWFTRDYGNMTNNGRILVELDGVPVLNAALQDVVTGRLGAPFVWPLVGNGDDTAGGSVIKVPMPYRQSMRVTVQNNPLFYHVDYRQFDSADGVTTFNPADPALDVISRLRGFGVRDPKPPAASSTTRTSTVDAPNGQSRQLAAVSGSGQVSQLRLRLPQVVPAPRVVDDGRAYGPGGGSDFTVAVDPGNSGVRLTRRYDPDVANQQAQLLVDGVPAGQWQSGASAGAGAWADQTVDIPGTLTAGKSVLHIQNRYLSAPSTAVPAHIPPLGPPKPGAPKDQVDRARAEHARASSQPAVVSGVTEFRYTAQSKVGGDWNRTDVVDLGPGHPGEEQAHGYLITNQTWLGTEIGRYPTSAAAVTTSNQILDGARIRVTVDGQSTVDAPVGEFFGSGLGDFDTRSLMSGMDTAPDGWFTAWWPMPFGRSVSVELVNASGVRISGGKAEVTTTADPAIGSALATGRLGYFHATHRRGVAQDGRDWTFLDASGRGVYYGVTHTMRGLIPEGNPRDYLEGDERVFVDGQASPQLHGTGTEDFYESGWYFRDGTTYAMPLAGNPGYETNSDGCRFDCTGAYRLLFPDAVAFNSGLKFGIEHGPEADEPADYSSTAYWYGQSDPGQRQSDLVDPTDPANRQAHGYTAAGETTSTVDSVFEGDDRAFPTGRGSTAATGPVTFTAAVDPGNDGVRLTRLADQQTPYQAADVAVDGQPVGRWTEPLGNGFARWLEDSFDVPPAVTAGKSAVRVTLAPVAGGPAWSASRYRVLGQVAPAPDTVPPGAVTGLTTASEQLDTVDLHWDHAVDDVGVFQYQLYAFDSLADAQDPAALTASNLVAMVVAPGYRDTKVGPARTRYYRVRAVDAAGNAGPPSDPVAGTSGPTTEVEGEGLLPPVDSTESVEAQFDCCGVAWSGHRQLWFHGAHPGDQVTLNFPVTDGGTYDLHAIWTMAGDYAIAGLAVDGVTLGQPVDLFHPGVVISPPIDYGQLALTPGTHQLTLRVLGKNQYSANYLVGLDKLQLTKLD